MVAELRCESGSGLLNGIDDIDGMDSFFASNGLGFGTVTGLGAAPAGRGVDGVSSGRLFHMLISGGLSQLGYEDCKTLFSL